MPRDLWFICLIAYQPLIGTYRAKAILLEEQ